MQFLGWQSVIGSSYDIAHPSLLSMILSLSFFSAFLEFSLPGYVCCFLCLLFIKCIRKLLDYLPPLLQPFTAFLLNLIWCIFCFYNTEHCKFVLYVKFFSFYIYFNLKSLTGQVYISRIRTDCRFSVRNFSTTFRNIIQKQLDIKLHCVTYTGCPVVQW